MKFLAKMKEKQMQRKNRRYALWTAVHRGGTGSSERVGR